MYRPRRRISHRPLLSLLALLPLAIVAADEPAVEPPDDPAEPAATTPAVSPAELKFWQAVRLLEGGTPADYPKGRDLLKAAADLEYAHAQVLLANCHLSGSYGFKREPRKAVGLFRLAATAGNAYAQVSLGQCLFSGTGTGKGAAQWLELALRPDADYSRPVPPADLPAPASRPDQAADTAGELATDQAASTRASAHFLLALIHQQRGDMPRAHPHFEAAATAGRAGLYAAAIQTALDYAFAQGVARDMQKASAMLELSTKLGVRATLSTVHSNVQLKIANDLASAEFEEAMAKSMTRAQQAIQMGIARSLADPKSKDYNLHEAVKWYEVAANNGQAWAMLSLAFIYSDGSLGKPDPEKAFAWFEKAGGGDDPKHTLGAANLAICLHNGLGVAKDPAKAAAVFKKYRDSSMLCYLGDLGRAPTKVTTYEEEHALTRQGADKGDAQALFLLGRRCEEGWDGPPDLKKAEGYFKRAGKAGNAAALCNLGVLYEFRGDQFGFRSQLEARRKAFECYQQSAERNNTAAMANVANILNSGWFAAADPAAAEKLYLRCIELEPEHGRALGGLGTIYENRLRAAVKNNDTAAAEPLRKKMLDYYEAAARLHNAYAIRDLGDLYSEGKLVPADQLRAYQHYTDAAERGLTSLHYRLGQMHEKGEGVPVTLDEAAYHYRLAALDGNLPALRRLCDLYLGDSGMARDLDRAGFWLSILARRGERAALTRFGDVLMRKGDYPDAFRFYTLLAKNGNEPEVGVACQRLGVLYENGWGVSKDSRRAESWRKKALRRNNLPALHDSAMAQMAKGDKQAARNTLEQAAARGFGPSKYQLACLYRQDGGAGAERIAKLVSDAARDGCVEAQIELARQTLAGAPGAPALEEAIRLVTEASEEGNTEARNLKSELEKHRPPAPTVPEEESAGARST